MTSTVRRPVPTEDEFDARCQHIRARILDEMEATLDELARGHTQLRARILDEMEATLDELARGHTQPTRAAIMDVVWAHVAPLACPQATCRRAGRCRRKPCVVRQKARSDA